MRVHHIFCSAIGTHTASHSYIAWRNIDIHFSPKFMSPTETRSIHSLNCSHACYHCRNSFPYVHTDLNIAFERAQTRSTNILGDKFLVSIIKYVRINYWSKWLVVGNISEHLISLNSSSGVALKCAPMIIIRASIVEKKKKCVQKKKTLLNGQALKKSGQCKCENGLWDIAHTYTQNTNNHHSFPHSQYTYYYYIERWTRGCTDKNLPKDEEAKKTKG